MTAVFLPIELDVAGRPAAVLGCDDASLARVDRLLSAGAAVTVYCCGGTIVQALSELCDLGNAVVREGTPTEDELERFLVVFSSPVLEALNVRLYAWACERGRLFCATDRPELSTFVSPAAAEVSGIGVRFSSAGVSPALAKRLRDDVAAALGSDAVARFVGALAALRASLPRGERAARMRAAVRGFELAATLRFPAWFERRGRGP